MDSVEDLHAAVHLYESQLERVRGALSGGGLTEERRSELTALEHNILELLRLTRQSLPGTAGADATDDSATPADATLSDDPLAAEYAAFKSELEELEGEGDEGEEAPPPPPPPATVSLVDIQEELEELSGCKCEAPHTDRLGATHYYNALVLSCHLDPRPRSSAHDTLDTVQVKVMFVNPTERDMVPCPYYLDGRCRFSDSDCNYSHGYLVPLSSLKEYREPEFGSVRSGSAVLAKVPGDEVWVSTRVEEVVSDEEVSVRHRGSTLSLPLHHILPLVTSADAGSDGEEDGQDLGRSDDGVQPTGTVSEEAVERSLTAVTVGSKRLGEWERHTKGIGSKLMAKMGYVVGAGLGRRGEGMVHPVQACVLPPGKSLDHCMRLREESGGDRDLFSVEKLQRRLKLKAERRSAAQYERSKRAEEHDVFTLVNSITARPQHSSPPGGGGDREESERGLRKELESSSERRLNVELLKTEEAEERTRREMLGLQRRLAVKKEGSVEFNRISAELSRASDTLRRLSHTASRLNREIRIRRTKKKMAF